MRAMTEILGRRGRWAAFAGCRRGAIAVEFALVFPVFLVLIFLLVELGGVLYVHNSLSYAVQEATRYAIVRGGTADNPATKADIETELKSRLVGIEPDDVAVQVTFTPDNSPGSTVAVQATLPYEPVVPFIPIGILNISTKTQMTIPR